MDYVEEKEKLVEKHEVRVDDMLNVLCFIGWQPHNAIWGGRSTTEAFDSACRVMRIDPVISMKIVRGDIDKGFGCIFPIDKTVCP